MNATQTEVFEYVRLGDDSIPPAESACIDVALLDMNHFWPNVGHDSLVLAVQKTTESLHEELDAIGGRVRLLSFDVRRRNIVPESPDGRFQLYIGTGGPGYLDPRLNDGTTEWCQGVTETTEWETPLFHLFDAILANESAAMLAICHSFGLVCRWSGVAHAELRAEKSSGMPLNRLTDEAVKHPWFSQFANELPDHQHFRVVDNRLFDLILDNAGKHLPIAFETEGSSALTMIELARDSGGVMPRFLGVNHHPEIVDREHIMQVLDEKRFRGEVTNAWYDERANTMRDLFVDENERQSQLTSRYTLLEPLRFHLARLIRARA